MNSTFLIGSGYHETGERSRILALDWYHNTMRGVPAGTKIAVVSTEKPFPVVSADIIDIHAGANLGHVHDLLDKRVDNEYCGWSISVLLLALYAYNARKDLIFKEADCFAFGDWVGEMYRQLGDHGMIFGRYDKMPAAQSLFLVRHGFIPSFVRTYLSLGPDSNVRKLPEQKFIDLKTRFTNCKCVQQFTMGYDRARPKEGILWCRDKAFYVQQVTDDELQQIKQREAA